MNSCPICKGSWKSDGPHRVVTLKCGHIFGHRCILQSLNNCMQCPLCNSRVRTEDVHPVFLDTSELSSLRKKLQEKEVEVRKNMEEKKKTLAENQQLKELIAGKEGELHRLQQRLASSQDNESMMQKEVEDLLNECERLEHRIKNQDCIKVRVRVTLSDKRTQELDLQIRITNKMKILIKDVAEKLGTPDQQIYLRFNGRLIHEEDTALKLGIKHQDVIHAYVRKFGTD